MESNKESDGIKNEGPQEDSTLSGFLGSLASAVTETRRIADMERLRLIRDYQRNVQTKDLTVPRLRLTRVEFEIPVYMGKECKKKTTEFETPEFIAQALKNELESIDRRNSDFDFTFGFCDRLTKKMLTEFIALDKNENNYLSNLCSVAEKNYREQQKIEGVFFISEDIPTEFITALHNEIDCSLKKNETVVRDESPQRSAGIQCRAVIEGLRKAADNNYTFAFVDGFLETFEEKYRKKLIKQLSARLSANPDSATPITSRKASSIAQEILGKLLSQKKILRHHQTNAIDPKIIDRIVLRLRKAVEEYALKPEMSADWQIHTVGKNNEKEGQNESAITRIKVVFNEEGTDLEGFSSLKNGLAKSASVQ